jgi:gliding motility-associated-like protein
VISSTQTVWVYAETGTVPNCTNENSFAVTIHQSPVVNLGNDTTLCDGNQIILNAGLGYDFYLWSTNANSQSITVSFTDLYSVTVTDENNCSGSDSIQINFISNFDATITTLPLTFCGNQQAIQFTAEDAGGIWTGTGIQTNGLFDPALAGVGIHEIVYTILGDCGDADTVNVTVFSYPVVQLGNDTTICSGMTITLDAGNGFNSYIWQPFGSTQTIDVSVSGIYTVTVTDDNLCTGSADITISVIDYADATILTTGPFCSNISPIQFISADGGGQWSGNGISTDGIFDPFISGIGNHLITYAISGICSSSDSVNILVHDSPEVQIEITHETCRLENDGSIEMNISGGVPPYQILWNTGSINFIINNLSPGIYTYMVYDFNNCSVDGNVTILAATEECNLHVYIPNIFSPNNDGENDVLFVRGKGIESIEFNIYNRWGEKVFETKNIDIGWDGTYKNKKLNQGVFAYIVKGKYRNNVEFNKSGTITLIY